MFAIIALVTAAGGLFSTLSYAVGRRRREFGIRAALGGSSRAIGHLVLRDAFITAVLGLGLGSLAAIAIAAFTPLPARLEMWSVVLGVCITAAVGLFFGAYPASRAAALDPIEALRRE